MLALSDIVKKTIQKTGLPKEEVTIIINTFLEEILLGLCADTKVKISRFGSFELKQRKHGNSPGYIKFKQSKLVKKLFSLIAGRNK